MGDIRIMKKFNQKYSFRMLRFIIIGLFTSLLAGFLIEYFHLGFDNELIVEFIFINRTRIYLLSVFIFFLIYTGITSLFGSSIIGSFLTILLTVIIGTTSHLKYIYRSEPLYPSELSMVTELPFLMDMITTTQLFITVSLIILVVSLMFFIYNRFSLKKELEYYLKELIFFGA